MKKLLTLTLLACQLTLHAQQPILGGELSNSAATSIEDIDRVMPRMRALGLNTVLVPVYWELTEPEEGRFDFSLVDRLLTAAREQQLRVVVLWFGAWKNSMSCYAPGWFKTDTRRFPRAMTAGGRQLEMASVFSRQVLEADLKAFSALMRHLADRDRGHGTVAMVQIENEVGMLESARDHSPAADSAYRQPMPAAISKICAVEAGTTWEQAYGDDPYGQERFMAYHYARYIEQLAKAARAVSDVPLYVNAAMNSRGRKPGEYPSAGPLAHLYPIWHTAAPTLDLLAPDIYDTGYRQWAAQYDLPGNPLFVPESRCCENSGVRALYTFGEHHAVGFSPFAIDQASETGTRSVTEAYRLLRQLYANADVRSALSPQPADRRRSWGFLFDQEDKERSVADAPDSVVITARHYYTLPWYPRASDGSTWPEGGALLVRLARYDYLLAGSGIVVDFKTPGELSVDEARQLGEDGFTLAATAAGRQQPAAGRTTSPAVTRLGLLSVDEVSVGPDGDIRYLRRHNGDQTHQGRHARIAVGEWKILHIRLYSY